MRPIPRAPGFDHTLALLRDPYRHLSSLARSLRSDVFRTRLLLTPTICLYGADAAGLFYSSGRIVRAGAGLRRIEKTLVGRGGVQGLDDEAHRRRKAMFLDIISEERIRLLCLRMDDAWRRFFAGLARGRRMVFYDEARALLMRETCAWAGVPLAAEEAGTRGREVAALFEYAGSIGPRHWWARRARRRCEQWMSDLVADVRQGRLQPPPESALHRIANHRDPDGRELSLDVAAVEVLNVIRPTLAVAVYLTQMLHALAENPECRQPLVGDAGYTRCFVQEVRRWYPFFPAVVGRVSEEFTWQEFTFPAGHRVILDLYGTNHDARSWSNPDDFHPERFRTIADDAAGFVPQGGGDRRVTHRCPGEPLAIALMGGAATHLARAPYLLPSQDMTLDYRQLPALPRSRMVIGGG
jgi:fatty-acid peroxygenase